MSYRYVFRVEWHIYPTERVLAEHRRAAGAFASMFVATDDASVAIERARRELESLGWELHPQPHGLATFTDDQLDNYHEQVRTTIRQALSEGMSSITFLCYERAEPDRAGTEGDFIWLLDWEADHDGCSKVDLDDGCAHVTAFVRGDSMLEAIFDTQAAIDSDGWSTNDWPEIVERIDRDDMEDSIESEYLGYVMEAFRDGHSFVYIPFERSDGYPDRRHPLRLMNDDSQEAD